MGVSFLFRFDYCGVCMHLCVCVRARACVSCLVMSYVTRRRAAIVKDGRFSSIYEAVSIKASQAS